MARSARTARSSRSRTVSSKPVVLTPGGLTIDDVVAVARYGRAVSISRAAVTAMKASRAVVEARLRDGSPYYGINTGFGSLANKRIADADLAQLQLNLVRSHSAGVGTPLPVETVRGMMLLLCGSLCRGLSGVRPALAEQIQLMLNSGLTPVVPSVGSVGASGDLAPLAAIACTLIGEGHVYTPGSAAPVATAKAMAAAKIKPVTLAAKEGLALINGTHLMATEAALLVHDAARLLGSATVALAMSIDACRATDSFLDERLYRARNNACGMIIAEQLRGLLDGSTILTSHLENDPRVQDPYSLRAGPTVLGAVYASLASIEAAASDELRAVTDNPLVIARGEHGDAAQSFASDDDAIISGANFHGMPVAIPLDHLAIALCHIAGISERRSYLMTGAFEPESKLKPFLAPQPGLQSGLMIAQYTAAACVNELVGLSAPASVANISTCAGMEDYNSWGPRAAAKARRAVELCTDVVAIELLIASQALELHRPLHSGEGVERVHDLIRTVVPPLLADRQLTDDISAIAGLIRAGKLL